MTDLSTAVAEYLRRERAGMAKPEGADHSLIMSAVAAEFQVDEAVLTEAVLDTAYFGAV